MCRRTHLRYRDILLWRTDNNMGNAAVMGLVPQVRYILLSDLLLETMTDEQVEAVFAHEVGHIVHRHMAWYVVLIVILMLGMSLGETMLQPHLPRMPRHVNVDIVMNVAGFVIFWTVFGFLSRRFERQADVYAARTIENSIRANSTVAKSVLPVVGDATVLEYESDCVGPHGASVFASVLYRVAVVNNIPVRAGNFTHGSIAARMNYLKQIASDPQRTGKFDRIMFGIYTAMIVALILCGSAAWIWRDKLMG